MALYNVEIPGVKKVSHSEQQQTSFWKEKRTKGIHILEAFADRGLPESQRTHFKVLTHSLTLLTSHLLTHFLAYLSRYLESSALSEDCTAQVSERGAC